VLQLFVAKNSTLALVLAGADFIAQRNILRNNVSARVNTDVLFCSYKRAGPKHPKITLPYISVVTAIACTSDMRTLLLCKPSSLAWHLMLLNAACALQIRLFNIASGLILALLMISPKYLNSATFSMGKLLQ